MIKLNAETVTKFVQLRAKMKALVTKEKRVSDAIKEAMQAVKREILAPLDSPYKLILNEHDKSDVDYKDMATQAYKEMYGKEWKVPFERAKKRYGRSDVATLLDRPNERYKP